MKKIIVTRRTDDWKAKAEDCHGIWGCGRTIDAAIGSVVQAHHEHFGISIEYPGDDLLNPEPSRNEPKGTA